MNTRVTLTWVQVFMAATVGLFRQIEALKARRPDRHGYEGDGWSIHIEGAAGEMAAAQAYGLFWDGSVNTFKQGGDVGDIQVRTRSKDYYELLVRADDRDEDIFVLVTGKVPQLTVRGWIRGADAKREEWLQTHGNRPAAYFVPQAALERGPLPLG